MSLKAENTRNTEQAQQTEEQSTFTKAERILKKVRAVNELRNLNLGAQTNQQVVKLLKELTDTISAFSAEKRSRFKIPPLKDTDFLSNLDYDGATVLIAEFGLKTEFDSAVIDSSRSARNNKTAYVSELNNLIEPEIIGWYSGAVGRDSLPANYRGIIFPKRSKQIAAIDPDQIDQNLHLVKGLAQVSLSEVSGGEPRTDISAYCRAFFIGKDVKSNNKYIDALRKSMQDQGGYKLEEDTLDITDNFSAKNSQIAIFDRFPKLKIFQFTGVRYQ